jgi:hypothetical protein
MRIQYAWHRDDRYYAILVKNEYRQLPWLLRSRSLAIIIWLLLSGLTLPSDLGFRTKTLVLGFITAFACVFPRLVTRGIILEYRLRPSIDAETTFKISDDDLVIPGPSATSPRLE